MVLNLPTYFHYTWIVIQTPFNSTRVSLHGPTSLSDLVSALTPHPVVLPSLWRWWWSWAERSSVLQNSYGKTLPPSVRVWWGRDFGRWPGLDEVLGSVPLWGPWESSLPPALATQKSRAVHNQEEAALTRAGACWHCDLRLPTSRAARSKFLFVSHLVYGPLLQQLEWTKTAWVWMLEPFCAWELVISSALRFFGSFSFRSHNICSVTFLDHRAL